MTSVPPVGAGGPNPYSEPPTASDGADLYIAKLLTQGGMAPPSEYKDSFEKAGVIGAEKQAPWADKLLKWAGITFVGALGILGARHLFFKGAAGKAANAAKTAAQKV